MARTVLVHSFRHGVGRSTIAANIGYLLAAAGQRVAIIETDTTSSAIRNMFRLGAASQTFYDYLNQRCSIEEAATTINYQLNGELYVVPGGDHLVFPGVSRTAPSYLEKLELARRNLITAYRLDTLIIDTEPGLSDEALSELTVPDVLILALRHDMRDYQGTGVTVDVVRKLNIARCGLIINEVPASFDPAVVGTELERVFQCEVLAVLPHAEEMMLLANKDIFVRHYPHHPVSVGLTDAALSLWNMNY
jgi:septum site-determining protein MinD